jgi:hypothetical protein
VGFWQELTTGMPGFFSKDVALGPFRNLGVYFLLKTNEDGFLRTEKSSAMLKFVRSVEIEIENRRAEWTAGEPRPNKKVNAIYSFSARHGHFCSPSSFGHNGIYPEPKAEPSRSAASLSLFRARQANKRANLLKARITKYS